MRDLLSLVSWGSRHERALPDEQGRCVGSDGEESCHEPVRVAHHGSEGWEHAAGYFRVLVQRGKKGVSG